MAISGQISNLSTDVTSGVIAVGEALTLRFTLKNTGSNPIRIHSMYVYRDAVAFVSQRHLLYEDGFGTGPVLAAGESRDMEFHCNMCDPKENSTLRSCTPYLHVYCEEVTGAFGEEEKGFVGGSVSLGLTVLNMRYQPRVEAFSVERTPSEESARVKATIRCSLAEGADSEDTGLSLKLRWREDGETAFPSANVVSVSVANALSSSGTMLTLSQTFSANKAYLFEAELTDGYDASAARTLVSVSHVNLHLAGSGYGVAVGMYSAGTQAAPLFESGYPARFYEGIEGVNVYTGEEVNTGGKWIDGKTIYARTLQFSTPSTANAQTNHAYDFSDVDEAWVDASATFIVAGNAASHLGYVAGNGNRLFMVQLQKSSNNILLISNVEGTAYIRMMYTKV